MKRSLILFAIVFFTSMVFISCKKCQECTTTTKQVVMGIEQNTSTSQNYCGKDYDNAPAEGTVVNNVGGINQEVTVSCKDK
jgi:hypothetical protein